MDVVPKSTQLEANEMRGGHPFVMVVDVAVLDEMVDVVLAVAAVSVVVVADVAVLLVLVAVVTAVLVAVALVVVEVDVVAVGVLVHSASSVATTFDVNAPSAPGSVKSPRWLPAFNSSKFTPMCPATLYASNSNTPASGDVARMSSVGCGANAHLDARSRQNDASVSNSAWIVLASLLPSVSTTTYAGPRLSAAARLSWARAMRSAAAAPPPRNTCPGTNCNSATDSTASISCGAVLNWFSSICSVASVSNVARPTWTSPAATSGDRVLMQLTMNRRILFRLIGFPPCSLFIIEVETSARKMRFNAGCGVQGTPVEARRRSRAWEVPRPASIGAGCLFGGWGEGGRFCLREVGGVAVHVWWGDASRHAANSSGAIRRVACEGGGVGRDNHPCRLAGCLGLIPISRPLPFSRNFISMPPPFAVSQSCCSSK